MFSVMSRLTCNGEQVQPALVEPPVVATAAMAFSNDFHRDDLAGPEISLEQIHDHLPAVEGHVIFPLIHGRHAVASHRRNAEELERDRHRVGDPP